MFTLGKIPILTTSYFSIGVESKQTTNWKYVRLESQRNGVRTRLNCFYADLTELQTTQAPRSRQGGGEVRWSAFVSSYKWQKTLSRGYFTPVSQLFLATYSDTRWVSHNSLANQKQPTFSSRFGIAPVDFKLQKFGIFFNKMVPLQLGAEANAIQIFFQAGANEKERAGGDSLKSGTIKRERWTEL